MQSNVFCVLITSVKCILEFLNVSPQIECIVSRCLWFYCVANISSSHFHCPSSVSQSSSDAILLAIFWWFQVNRCICEIIIFQHVDCVKTGSLVTIVTTDFEPLYAYKCSDYQQCLPLSRQNVHTLLYIANMPILSFP